MIRFVAAAILSGWLVLPAMAAGLDAASINNAEYRAKLPSDDRADAVVVKLQVLLDRARFSPGEIDGKLGENAQKALSGLRRGERLGRRQVVDAGGLGYACWDKQRRRHHRVHDL